MNAVIYLPDYRIYPSRWTKKKKKKKKNRIFIHNELATKTIMDCRTTTTHKFRKRLGFKQYDIIFTKEQ